MNLQFVLRSAAFAGALLFGVGATRPAQAATFTVTNSNDAGAGSLRQAVQNANNVASNDTILFATSGPITLTSGQITIANNGALTISRASAARVTVNGNAASRIFAVAAGATITLNQLVLSNGHTEMGAAIYNSGTLTVNDCVFNSNLAESASQSSPPGVNSGGAIHNTGNLFVYNSTFEGNKCYEGNGGAIFNVGSASVNGSFFTRNVTTYGSGGAIENRDGGTLAVDTSTFYLNGSEGGRSVPAVYATGAAIGTTLATTTVNRSTFNQNYGGGASVNFGPSGRGALYNFGGRLSVTLSSFYFNLVDTGSAIYNDSSGSEAIEGSSLSVDSCTIYRNDAYFGGGIYNASGVFNLNNSIVAGNTTGNEFGPNIYGTVTSGDYNLIDDVRGATLSGTHNILGQNARISPLADNAGPTQTFALLKGSPAIDAANSSIPIDQRGHRRPRDLAGVPNAAGGNGSDIGAFEYGDDAPSAANFVVNKTDDHNDGACSATDCTLREALSAANADPRLSTITFDAVVFAAKQTLTVLSTLPAIDSDVNLVGPTRAGVNLMMQAPNGQTYNPLVVHSGTVTVANLTFILVSSGLTIYDGNVTVNSCSFINCRYGIQSGGDSIGVLKGDDAIGRVNLTVNNSTFWSNTSGVIQTSPGTDTATLNSCTFTQNRSGITVGAGTMNLSNSIVAGNETEIQRSGGTLNISRSITSGDAGLDPAGFKYNGGPTPTVALLPGSPAINAGATTLSTDQRGVARDSLPDIGAFEFNNVPPTVSVSPQNASDKVGAKRTFTLTVSDANGANEIRDIYLLINETLSWDTGATFIYVPGTSSPASGLLYLRRGDAFLPPVPVGAGSSSRAILDNGAVRVAANEVTVSLSPDGRTLTLSIPATIRDGLVGRNTLFVRAQDRQNSFPANALAGDDGYVRAGTYTVTPQFSGETNSAPTLSRLNPSLINTTLNSSGVAPTAQTFTFAVKDDNGTGDIESLWFLAGKQLSWANSATLIYQPRSRRLYLRSDDGNSFLGGAIIGTSGILENSQVRLDLSKVKTTIYPDGKTLALSLPLQAKSGLLGQNKVWLRTQDTLGATAPNGDDQGYVQSGIWNVGQSTTARTAPSTSAGGS